MKYLKVVLVLLFCFCLCSCGAHLTPKSRKIATVKDNTLCDIEGGLDIRIQIKVKGNLIQDIDKTFSYAKAHLTKEQFENFRANVKYAQEHIACKVDGWKTCSVSGDGTYVQVSLEIPLEREISVVRDRTNVLVPSSDYYPSYSYCRMHWHTVCGMKAHSGYFPFPFSLPIDFANVLIYPFARKKCPEHSWKIWIGPEKDKTEVLDIVYDSEPYINFKCNKDKCSILNSKGQELERVPVFWHIRKNSLGEKKYVARVKAKERQRLKEEQQEKRRRRAAEREKALEEQKYQKYLKILLSNY